MTLKLKNMKRKIISSDMSEKTVKKKKVISATSSVIDKSLNVNVIKVNKKLKNKNDKSPKKVISATSSVIDKRSNTNVIKGNKKLKHKTDKCHEVIDNSSKKNKKIFRKIKKTLKHKENTNAEKVENISQKTKALDSTESHNKSKKKWKSSKFSKKRKKTDEEAEGSKLMTFPQSRRITIPKEVSCNWNALSQIIIEDTKKTAETDSEQSRHHKPPKGLKKPHKDIGKNDELKEPDIWFDDVDEMLLDIEARKVLRKRNGENIDENSVLKTGTFDGLTNAVAIDCEMVGVGIYGRDNMLARVSIVNENGQCLYDKYVKEMEDVKDYRTQFSGITPELLKDGEDFFKVQKEVSEILKGRILVGHDLTHDLKVLFLQHDKKRIRDTSKYKVYRSLFGFRTPSLKKLVKEVLGLTIQEGEHDSVIDAMSAMRLYTLYKKQWETELKEERRKKQLKALKLSKAGSQKKEKLEA